MSEPTSEPQKEFKRNALAPFPTEPPTKEMEAYWRDLGRFVHQFAQVEKFLLGTLWRYAGLTLIAGQAVLSGIRTKEACSLLNRLFEARGIQDSVEGKDMVGLTAQIGHITEMRNAILHFGTRFDEGENFLVDNRHIAFNDRRVREFPASSSVLKQMTADLDKIDAHLSIHFFGQWGTFSALPEDYRSAVQSAWQYKPPPQAAGQQRPRDVPPKRKRRP